MRRYLLAMDDVARHKARRIGERVHLDRLPARSDGASGSFSTWPGARAGWRRNSCVATRLAWRRGRHARGGGGGAAGLGRAESGPRLSFVGLDLLSEALPAPPDGSPGWDVIVLSNIVHAFAEAESGGCWMPRPPPLRRAA